MNLHNASTFEFTASIVTRAPRIPAIRIRIVRSSRILHHTRDVIGLYDRLSNKRYDSFRRRDVVFGEDYEEQITNITHESAIFKIPKVAM